MLNKFLKTTQEGLHKLSKTTSKNPNEYILLEEIYEDTALREIIEEKLNIYNHSKGKLVESMYLTIKNLDSLTITNIKNDKIVLGFHEEIPYVKPLEIYSDKVFYKSYVSKNKFYEILDSYILEAIKIKGYNQKRISLVEMLEDINKNHNGYIQYMLSSQNEKEIYLQLKDIEERLLTNVKISLKESLEDIKSLLVETQNAYINIFKQKIKESYLQEIDSDFDTSRIEFDCDFSYHLNGKISLSNDKEDIQKLVKGITLENLLNTKYPILKDYFHLITINDKNDFDFLEGSIGLDTPTESIHKFAKYLMEKIQSYYFIKYHQSFDNIPYSESKLDWLSYQYIKDLEFDKITISLHNEDTLVFKMNHNVKEIVQENIEEVIEDAIVLDGNSNTEIIKEEKQED